MQNCKGVSKPMRSGKPPQAADNSPPSNVTLYRHTLDCSLYMYANADWARDPNDRVSSSGYVLFFGRNLVSWSSKKKQVVARSSTKVEYKSVVNSLPELTWVRNLLNELCITIPNTPIIFYDNVGVTYLCHNPVFHSRMKHIVNDFCYVRNQVQAR
ncbi:hypothetical protein T459_11442 [Capsicum annuum]|uniref:Uncharacterized protein n=1 Tax=Capsicum annuum TaxID=4072 RepID=A0A2G2ZLY2_CAPAN|nr:hypothetical protein T459_11442 [Capsicum annuum]